MEKKELVNLLKKEVSKKKFKENFFEELLREHEDAEILLSDDKILNLSVKKGSKELIDYLIRKDFINEKNSFTLLDSAYQRDNQIFKQIVSTFPNFTDLFFNAGLWKNKEIVLNEHIADLNLKNMNSTTIQEKSVFDITGDLPSSFYNRLHKTLLLEKVRECLVNIVEDEDIEKLQILKQKSINLNYLKLLKINVEYMPNLIEKWIKNNEITKLKFVLENDYISSVTDLIYLNPNESNENNIKLVQLYLDYDSDILNKKFLMALNDYSGQFISEMNLTAFLFEKKEHIKTSFLNYLIANSDKDFYNDQLTFLLYHREDKRILNKRKLFKFLKLDINFNDKIDGESNLIELLYNEGNLYNLNGKEWVNFIDKAKQKGFALNEPLQCGKTKVKNMLEYSLNLSTHRIYGDIENKEKPMVYCLQNGVDPNIKINNFYSKMTPKKFEQLAIYVQVSPELKNIILENPLSNIKEILQDFIVKSNLDFAQSVYVTPDVKNKYEKELLNIKSKMNPELFVKTINETMTALNTVKVNEDLSNIINNIITIMEKDILNSAIHENNIKKSSPIKRL